MFDWFRDNDSPSICSLFFEIRYHRGEDLYLVGYDNQPNTMSPIVGSGETLEKALYDIADVMDISNKTERHDATIFRDATPSSLSSKIYYAEEEREYIAVLDDGEMEVSGRGRSISLMFESLGENTTVSRDESE